MPFWAVCLRVSQRQVFLNLRFFALGLKVEKLLWELHLGPLKLLPPLNRTFSIGCLHEAETQPDHLASLGQNTFNSRPQRKQGHRWAYSFWTQVGRQLTMSAEHTGLSPRWAEPCLLPACWKTTGRDMKCESCRTIQHSSLGQVCSAGGISELLFPIKQQHMTFIHQASCYGALTIQWQPSSSMLVRVWVVCEACFQEVCRDSNIHKYEGESPTVGFILNMFVT